MGGGGAEARESRKGGGGEEAGWSGGGGGRNQETWVEVIEESASLYPASLPHCLMLMPRERGGGERGADGGGGGAMEVGQQRRGEEATTGPIFVLHLQLPIASQPIIRKMSKGRDTW